jgi:hypothetical protein
MSAIVNVPERQLPIVAIIVSPSLSRALFDCCVVVVVFVVVVIVFCRVVSSPPPLCQLSSLRSSPPLDF